MGAEGGSARPLQTCRWQGPRYGVFTGYSGKAGRGAIAIGRWQGGCGYKAGAGSCGSPAGAAGWCRLPPRCQTPVVPGARPERCPDTLPGRLKPLPGCQEPVPRCLRCPEPTPGCSEPALGCPALTSGCSEPSRDFRSPSGGARAVPGYAAAGPLGFAVGAAALVPCQGGQKQKPLTPEMFTAPQTPRCCALRAGTAAPRPARAVPAHPASARSGRGGTAGPGRSEPILRRRSISRPSSLPASLRRSPPPSVLAEPVWPCPSAGAVAGGRVAMSLWLRRGRGPELRAAERRELQERSRQQWESTSRAFARAAAACSLQARWSEPRVPPPRYGRGAVGPGAVRGSR